MVRARLGHSGQTTRLGGSAGHHDTGLIQVARTDILRQVAPALTDTWNFDNSKGVNLVPWANTELAFNLPPYLKHNSKAVDGFGDVSFLGKYRIAAATRSMAATR